MAETPEQRRARKREWYLRNREKILEKKRAYDAANPRDPERRREQSREYERRRGPRKRHREYIPGKKRARPRENPEYTRTRRMRVRHGMSPDGWAVLWDAQDGRCYLCGAVLVDGKVHVDHDHSCCPRNRSCRICRRGLACDCCNSAIGMAGDDPARLRRMADALETAQALVEQRKADAGQELTLFTVTPP